MRQMRPSNGVLCTPTGINQDTQNPHPFITGLVNKSKEVKENKYKKDSKALLSSTLNLVEDLIRLEESQTLPVWQIPEQGIGSLAKNIYINGLSLGVYRRSQTTGNLESITIEYHMSADTLYVGVCYMALGKGEPLHVLVENASEDEPEIVNELKRYFNILAGKGELEPSSMPLQDRRLYARQAEYLREEYAKQVEYIRRVSMQPQGMYPNMPN